MADHVRGIRKFGPRKYSATKNDLNYLKWKPTVVIAKSNMKRYYSFFFFEDQEFAKSGSKKWKVQEESAHYILWRREGSNKIEKSESESFVSMQGQGFLDSKERL